MLIIDPSTLKLQIDNYFEQVKNLKHFSVGTIVIDEDHPTVTGLALFLGFSSKNHFKTYMDNPEYEETIKYALLRAENFYEKEALKGNANVKVMLEWFGGWKDLAGQNTTFNLAQFMKDVSTADNNRIAAVVKE